MSALLTRLAWVGAWAWALVSLSVPASAQTAGPAAVQDTMAQRMQACVVCHGSEGRATNTGYFPRIAGKPAGYLYNQLINFQQGRRTNAAMSHLLANLTDDYLREMAQYFAELDLPYPLPQPSPQTAEQAQAAERLVRQGAAERGLPACVQCHGAGLTGQQPAIPGLLGLSRHYLVAQFGAWRNDIRHTPAPDCMADIAQRLNEREISALAVWLSAQPTPADTRPEPAPATPLPMRCAGTAP